MSIRVGVIDSGYRPDQQNIVHDSAAFYLDDGALWMGESSFDAIDHGGRIIDIIHHHCATAQIISAQVFDQRGITSAVQVAAALDWMCEQAVQVVNLSLGLRQNREVLEVAVKQAVEAGMILCASSPARGDPVYPSAYPGVFRMTGDARCKLEEISCLDTEFADFGGYVLGFDGEQSKAGASLGCAHLCGHIAHILNAQPQLDRAQVYTALKQAACYFGPENRLF